MNRKNIVFFTVIAMTMVLLLAPAGPVLAAEGKITIYTSVPQPIINKIQQDFQTRFPKIELTVFRSGTSAVTAKIEAEKTAGKIMADLVWVAEPSTYEDFKAEGLLHKFTPPEAANLPMVMKDPEGYYYAGRVICMIVGYNTGVKPPPAGWKDLLKADYKGKLGFPSPLRSGAAQASVEAIVDALGWSWFEDFKANGGVQVKNNSTMRDQLSTGEMRVGALLDYMVRAAKKKGSPIDYIWPVEGTVVIPSPIGIMKNTGNAAAAETFVNFVISKEGQQTMVELGNFLPVRNDVAPPAGAPAFDKIKALPVDWKKVRDQRDASKGKWTEIFQ